MPSRVDTFFNMAVATLAAADEALLREEIKWTLDEFFLVSQCWYETLPSFTVAAGTVFTNMTTQANRANQKVAYVDQIFVGEKPIPFVRDIGNVSDSNDTALEFSYVTAVDNPEVIRWVPVAERDITDVVAKVIYVGTNYDVTLPEFVLTHHKDAVINGVYARMLMHDNKPYSNAVAAQMRDRRFRAYCRKIRDTAQRGYNTSDRMWSFSNWGTRGRV
jgi:hypothetical protein